MRKDDDARVTRAPRRIARAPWAARLPGVGAVARALSRIAAWKVGRIPVGLMLLLPVAVLIDVFDTFDEAFLGPVGVAAAFVLEAGFLVGVTGRSTWALGAAGIDLIPLVDVLPLATLTVLARIAAEWAEPSAAPVIDVEPERVV